MIKAKRGKRKLLTNSSPAVRYGPATSAPIFLRTWSFARPHVFSTFSKAPTWIAGGFAAQKKKSHHLSLQHETSPVAWCEVVWERGIFLTFCWNL